MARARRAPGPVGPTGRVGPTGQVGPTGLVGPTDAALDLSNSIDADIDAHLRLALASWPEIDPAVEAIVTLTCKAAKALEISAQTSLRRVSLTKEEFKVFLSLHTGPRSHGDLCKLLGVSTGTMTNRLDKMERSGWVARSADPTDRRGVLLELTAGGRAKLDETIALGAHRERELLGALSPRERDQLDRLLRKLVTSLRTELGDDEVPQAS